MSVKVFDGLNEAQRRAVAAANDNVLVVAGPGTGKTLTIVRRIAYLVEHGIPPEQILALTFSNRAAREMRERVAAFLGDVAAHIFIGTFHLFGLRFLKKTQTETGRICTRDDQIEMIQSITGKGSKHGRRLAERISKIKNGVEVPDDDIGPVYDAYQDALAERGGWDFDDLIRIPAELLKDRMIGGEYCTYSHVVVDEYQDVSPMQYSLLRLVSLAASASVWAVGDPDQAIYAFRGADAANFRKFQNDFTPSLIILGRNYRSSGTIVGACNAIIANNRERFDKELQAAGEEGQPISIVSVPDERAEAELIAREIESRMGGTSHYRIASQTKASDYAENTYGFSDFAVLYRTNVQAAALREALESWGIPSQVIAPKNRTVGDMFIERFRSSIEDWEEGADLVASTRSICEEVGMNLAEALIIEGIAASYRTAPFREGAVALIDELLFSAEMDNYDAKADKVVLMTMHSAKGLEFRTVFIAGCCDGVLPHNRSNENGEIEEERRLFYVSVTRAREELLALCPRRYPIHGQKARRSESIFLSEIPRNLVRSVNIPDPPMKSSKGKQQSLF